ncbi:MAG: response regulator transcription factor [Phenylobacterium sp.]|uniref:response regulator transcription factor n=1 Tax=Phenylobacterium sp. TaxID=1871053 RepID=UPI001A53D062|nr:response regulator transcription factor [Phenylobacterium sp.]MBL8774266.1 response regulator transcription factor [Phenylobacterium sp.]
MRRTSEGLRGGGGVKFLVVDDHAVVREGLAAVLRGVEPGATVLEAGDCASALAHAAAHRDIALTLMDLSMPDATGVSAVAAFVAAHPAIPLMVVSSSDAPADVRAALALGALGYVAKAANASTLAAAIRLVLSGEVYVPPFMARVGGDAAPGPAAADTLTERQRAVLGLIREGASNKEIAYRLGVTEATVKAHLTTIFRVLGVANRAEAVRKAGA